MDNILIIFLRYPEPGKVKTRLARAIGNEKACAVYTQLAEGVIKNVFSKKPKTYDVYIFFTPAEKRSGIKDWLMPILNNDAGVDIPCISQEGDNLGERISNAFLQVFQENGRKRNVQDSDLFYRGKNIQHNEMVIRGVLNRPHCNTIIIGTDCPGVDARLIENAFELLKKKDVVIGPCEDGGYYLLGMSRFIPDLFIDIIWGTDQVLSQTIGRVQKNGLSYSMLKKLTDIDIIEDMYQHMPDFL